MLELGEKVELNSPLVGPGARLPELLFFMTRFPIAQAGLTLTCILPEESSERPFLSLYLLSVGITGG